MSSESQDIIHELRATLDQKEIELNRISQRFKTIIDALPNGILIVDGYGKISLCNDEAIRLFGYDRDDFQGMEVERLVPDRFRSKHAAYRESYFCAPQTRAMGAGRDLFGKRSDGSEFPIEIGLNPLTTDEGIFILAAIVDISERKAAEERFRSVVESTPNALIIINSSGMITFINSQTEQLFGFPRSLLIEKPIEKLVPVRFREFHPNYRDSFFQNPASRPMGAGRDLFGLHADGREIPLEIGLKPIMLDGQQMVLAAIVDITERNAIDEKLRQANTDLQQKNHEMEQFIYTVSHDLKSPLVTSMSYLQFIREDLSKNNLNEILDSLGRLERANQRMAKLINDLMLLSRIGRLELKLEIVDIRMLVDEIYRDLNGRYVHKLAKFAIEDGIANIFADRFRLTQLFENLIANAFKYGTNHSKPVISIGSKTTSTEVLYFIKDNGSGIPPDSHRKIFVLFERLVNDKDGTGVGLAIVARVAQLHGGRVWVESEPGSGATFWIAFPIAMLR